MFFNPINDRMLSPRKSGMRPAVVAVLLVLAMYQVSCRSREHGQDQPSKLTGTALAEFTSLEPIDAHTHISQAGPAFLGMLDHLHMRVLDILYVDDTDPNHAMLERQRQDAVKFIASSNGHAWLCTTFDPFQFNNANFSREAIRALNQDFANGAVAAKIWKNIGMEIKDGSGNYLMPDDPRLEPIYKDIAAHNRTLLAHVAEPDEAWGAPEPTGFSTTYYQQHPQWDMSKTPDAPQKNALLRARDHLLAMNPELRVVGVHFGSMETRLNDLAKLLDQYPNFAVDTAGRVRRLVTQPRDDVRAFFLKYQDRILYGTDLHSYSDTTDAAATQSWARQYALDWRYFSSDDTFEYGGQKVKGLGLPRSVLKKLYHENAVRWIPGIASEAH
jgi:predicted TIM-barrel fold metal-dependent hydrolase